MIVYLEEVDVHQYYNVKIGSANKNKTIMSINSKATITLRKNIIAQQRKILTKQL